MSITGTVLVYVSSLAEEHTAGEEIPARSVVSLSETEERVYMAQATSWSRMPAIGITQAGVNADKTAIVFVAGSIASVSRTENFSSDDPVFVSETAGKLTKYPPDAVGRIQQEVGRAKNNSGIVLNIQEAVELEA